MRKCTAMADSHSDTIRAKTPRWAPKELSTYARGDRSLACVRRVAPPYIDPGEWAEGYITMRV